MNKEELAYQKIKAVSARMFLFDGVFTIAMIACFGFFVGKMSLSDAVLPGGADLLVMCIPIIFALILYLNQMHGDIGSSIYLSFGSSGKLTEAEIDSLFDDIKYYLMDYRTPDKASIRLKNIYVDLYDNNTITARDVDWLSRHTQPSCQGSDTHTRFLDLVKENQKVIKEPSEEKESDLTLSKD